MNKSLSQFILFFAGSFVCLYLAFSPVVNIPYISHDSIRYFHKFYNKEGDAQRSPMYDYLKNDGRFVAAEFEEFLYKHINHLSDVSRLRLAVIIGLSLCAALLIMSMCSQGMEAIPAFCLGTVIFTLPGIQDFIFVPYPSLAAATLLSLLACGRPFILAFVLLEVAFFMYPPATFFFLMPAMFLVIFHHDRELIKRRCGRDVLLWALAAAANYLILRIFFYTQMKATGHEIAFSFSQVLFNIAMFLPQAAPQVFNLWNVYYSQGLGISLMLIIDVFIAVDLFTNKKLGVKRLLALTVLFLIFNMVWFFFGGYMPRQFIAAQAMALVLIYWCGQKFGNSRLWPALILCFGLIVGNRMMTSNVMNNHSELMFIRSRLAQFVNSSTREIHIIRLKDTGRGYNGLPTVYDNINSSTSDYEIPDLIRIALKDMGDPFELHCIVTYSDYGRPYSLLPNAVVIDMNDLVYISSPELK